MADSVDRAGLAPLAIVVMGVSGSGKSTLGMALAERMGCAFLEGDDFHPAANVDKMRRGIPLTDEDRWPWLDRLGAAMAAEVARAGPVVASCSALRRVYRERLEHATGGRAVFILLDVPAAELDRRLRHRPGHYMPASLLDSQLRTLERPTPDEPAITFDATTDIATLADEAMGWLATRP